MKMRTPEYIEGPEAWKRFDEAVRKVLTVPKSAVPNPFGKRKPKTKKPAAPKGLDRDHNAARNIFALGMSVADIGKMSSVCVHGIG